MEGIENPLKEILQGTNLCSYAVKQEQNFVTVHRPLSRLVRFSLSSTRLKQPDFQVVSISNSPHKIGILCAKKPVFSRFLLYMGKKRP